MKRRDAFEIYTNYLLASPNKATATGLSAVLDNQMKHDYISDFLADKSLDSKAYWKEIKPFVRQIENEEGALLVDDTIVEKPHTSENDIICYHWDHTKNKSVKGINLLNFLLRSEKNSEILNCPVSYEIIKKTERYIDKKGKEKRKSTITKNEMVIETLHRLTKLNKIKYKYILFDTWFGASDTLEFIHHKLNKKFVCPLKSNRLIALNEEDKYKGRFVNVSEINMESEEVKQVWVKGLDFPVNLVKQIFINKDDSTAELWLITNETELNYDQTTTIYQKRWKVEELHKSLKQNTLLGKSPTKMEVTQSNHIFSSMIAYIKLEKIKVKERLNHFALKDRFYVKMIRMVMDELQILQNV